MKKILSLVLAAVMVVSMFAGLQISSSALEPTGQCGENVYYTFNSSTGTLTISGEGNMYDNDDTYSPFYSDGSITGVVIQNGITRVGSNNFYGCTNIKTVTLPGSLQEIGTGAFYGCSSLTSINIPNSVTDISYYAFSSTPIYNDVNWKNGLLYFDNWLLDADEETISSNVSVAEGTVGIAGSTFYRFDALTGISLPASMKYLCEDWVVYCHNLKSLTVSDKNEMLDSRNNCNAIIETSSDYLITGCSKTVIPSSVTTIGYSAFYGCATLTSISIPNSVTTICAWAFASCENLKSITIPASVDAIYWYAFKDCESLKNVYYNGTRAQWNKIDIDEDGNEPLISATLHTTDAHVHSYKTVVVAPKANALGYTCYKCSCGQYKKNANGNVIKTAFKAPTGKPAGVRCAARTASAEKFAWNKTSGATGYQVQLLNSAGKNVKTVSTKSTAYTFSKLAAGTVYKVRVRFYIKAADGKNYFSKWSAVLTSPTLPKGTSVTKVTAAKKAFTAKWGKVAGVTGYQINYKYYDPESLGGAPHCKTVTIKGAAKTSFTAKNLLAKTKYEVKVRTYKTIGGKTYVSNWSKVKTVKTK